MEKSSFTVEGARQRIDKFLADQYEGMTRSYLQKLIKNGDVLVNGEKVKSSFTLSEGDKVEVTVPDAEPAALTPENIPLDVIYEDGDVIVINKPAGMVVHPTDGDHNQTGTLVNALLFHCKDLSGIGGVRRPGIVHRLDKGTSGVMVIAKNDKAHQSLSAQIKAREVRKQYLTLVKGRLQPETGTIDAPVGRSLIDRKKMAVIEHQASRDAVTHYKVERVYDGPEFAGACSYLEVDIVTGRTHQIRVHFQSIGFPVIGDETYGDRKTNVVFKKLGLKRPFLHAWKLGFKLPSSGELKQFEAKLPEDLEKVLVDLG